VIAGAYGMVYFCTLLDPSRSDGDDDEDDDDDELRDVSSVDVLSGVRRVQREDDESGSSAATSATVSSSSSSATTTTTTSTTVVINVQQNALRRSNKRRTCARVCIVVMCVRAATRLQAVEVAVKLMNVPHSVHDRCVLHDIFTEILILEHFRGDRDACRLYDYGLDHEHYWICMRRYCGSLKQVCVAIADWCV
jgi:hypothetical protein